MTAREEQGTEPVNCPRCGELLARLSINGIQSGTLRVRCPDCGEVVTWKKPKKTDMDANKEKTEDPDRLRARIASLERQLREKAEREIRVVARLEAEIARLNLCVEQKWGCAGGNVAGLPQKGETVG